MNVVNSIEEVGVDDEVPALSHGGPEIHSRMGTFFVSACVE